VYCLVDVFVPSLACTVNVETVFVPTLLALPEKEPLELKVNPAGIEPDEIEKVILSPSSSVAVTWVRLEPASPPNIVPKEPEATEKAGAASILKASAKVFAKFDELFVTLTS
jgi:hypothetical protein